MPIHLDALEEEHQKWIFAIASKSQPPKLEIELMIFLYKIFKFARCSTNSNLFRIIMYSANIGTMPSSISPSELRMSLYSCTSHQDKYELQTKTQSQVSKSAHIDKQVTWRIVVKNTHGVNHLYHLPIGNTSSRSSVLENLRHLAENHGHTWRLFFYLKKQIIESVEIVMVNTLQSK